jgi:hypothetical protein
MRTMQYEDADTWSEENELWARKEAGDIVHGDDPSRPPLIPKGDGPNAQLFRGIFDPRLYADDPPVRTDAAAYYAQINSKETERRLALLGSQAENILDATSYLNFQYGVVLNTHIVLAHERSGIMDHDKAAELMSLLFHRMRKWFHRRQQDALYIYVHENSPRHGFHTHVLLHVPGDLWGDFKAWFKGAVECLWGCPLPDKMLNVGHRRQRDFSHQVMLQWIWVRYLLKGIWPGLGLVSVDNGEVRPVHEVLRLRPRPGGLVLCRKRSGVSSNIGHRARDKAGYLSLFALGQDDRLFSGDEFQARADCQRREAAEAAARQIGFTLGNL